MAGDAPRGDDDGGAGADERPRHPGHSKHRHDDRDETAVADDDYNAVKGDLVRVEPARGHHRRRGRGG